MLKYYNYDIVFEEIPNEITLAFSITNCPNNCPECHSPWLREDIGNNLIEDFDKIIKENLGVTAILFLGGDNQIEEFPALLEKAKNTGKKIGIYSGMKGSYVIENLDFYINNFDYIKLGPYVKELGGLASPSTNQRLYKKVNGQLQLIKMDKRHKEV